MKRAYFEIGEGIAPPQFWMIGRDPQCNVIVDSLGVSSRHCIVTGDDDSFALEALGSTNGTYVNGQRVTSRVVVTILRFRDVH
jgi:pSer/pThr/pTyr-binding forkhead associated (FHA) protein